MSPISSYNNINLDDLFQALKSFLSDNTGIVLQEEKKYLLEVRLFPFFEQHNIQSPLRFMKDLTMSHALAQDVISLFTTNETFFFRDAYVFEELVDLIIPEIISKKEDTSLRILSAACSSGQEAYTIAMQIDQKMPQLKDWNVEILGIDIDHEIVQKAQKGWYTQFEVNRGIPMRYLFRCFQRSGRGYQIKDSIASLVRFEQRNLMEEQQFSNPFDIVLLRNVLIYFSTEEQNKQVENMIELLSPEGVFIIGSTEIIPPNPRLKRNKTRKMIWYQATK